MLATSGVVAFVVFFGSILEWFGWLPDTDEGGVFEGFRFWLLVLELAAIVASAVALRLFEFPLLVLLLAASSWFFVTDLISGGGNWSAIVTIAVGLVFLLAAIAVDDGPSRPFGFWLHVAAGLTIGGGLVWFFHDGAFDWIVVGVVGAALHPARRPAGALELGRASVAGACCRRRRYFADKWSDISDALLSVLLLFPVLHLVRRVTGERTPTTGSARSSTRSRASSSSGSGSGWRAVAAKQSPAPSSCSPKLEFPA